MKKIYVHKLFSAKASAIVTALIFIVIGSLITGGFLTYVMREVQMTNKLNSSIKAFYIAEAGLERACKETYDDWYNHTPKLFRLNGIAPTNFPDPLSSYSQYEVVETWVNVNIRKRIASTGTYGNETRTVYKDVYHPQQITGAIIACSGSQGTGKISGNVRIMGSVYISGEEPFVDSNENDVYDVGEFYRDISGNGAWGQYLDITDGDTTNDNAFRMTGNSEIGNNYGYMPSDLKSRVPSIYDSDISMDTLDARLLVKYGRVPIESGSAMIGITENPSDGLKNTMDSVIIPDGDVVPHENIHTDEYLSGAGNRSLFDDEVRIPSIKDAYTDNATGNFYASPANPYTSDTLGGYEQYLYTIATGTGGVFINGDLTIAPNSNILYGDINTPGASGLSVDGNGNLKINGLVYVNGKLTINSSPGKGTMYYSGRGSFYVRGYRDADTNNDVEVKVNLLTKNSYKGAFPASALGIMTRENILLSGANNHIMGAFYAGNSVKMTKQYEIAGTVMSTYFDMTDQVPSIYQIPILADNPPTYMIPIARGGERIDFKEWSEHQI
jgi:hypothetical protein